MEAEYNRVEVPQETDWCSRRSSGTWVRCFTIWHDGKSAGLRSIKSMGMPSTLREVGVEADRFELVAKNALLARWVHANPRKVSRIDVVLEILRMAA